MPVRAAALGHLPEAQVGLPVEPGVGLVEQQQLRIVQQREREVELLARAARELLDAVVEVLGEAQLVQQPVARRPQPPRSSSRVGLREQLEVLGDRQLVPQQRLLRAVAEPRRAPTASRRRGRAARR